jgi:hypothetical protein
MFTQVKSLYTNVVGNNVHVLHPHGVRNCYLQIVFLLHFVCRFIVYLPDFILLAPVDYLVAIKRKNNEKLEGNLFYSFTFHTHI